MNVSHLPPDCPGACCGPVHSYTQCRLTKWVDHGELCQVAWIPTQFASIGRRVRIRVAGEWIADWVVRSVGATKPGRDKEDGVICNCDTSN